jgi:Fic family protein
MDWVKEAFQKYEPKPKGWVTIRDIMKLTGHTENTVRKKVAEMIKNELLEERKCTDAGSVVKCYRKKGKK